MRVPHDRPPAPVPHWRLVRIALIGLCASVGVMVVGPITERLRLGADDAAARTRIQADVRQAFTTIETSLRLAAQTTADPDAMSAALAGDTAAARRLFAAAERAIPDADEDEWGVTLYGRNDQPLAWAGRPSEVGGNRLEGNETWFFAEGPIGPRLAYLSPVISNGVRIGSVVAERVVSPAMTTGTDRADSYTFQSALAPVSIVLTPTESASESDPDAFEVFTPSGDRLLSASVTAVDLTRTRQRSRRVTRSIAIATCAVTILLLCGPLLDWRNRTTRRSQYVVAVLACAGAILAARWLLRLASPADWLGTEVFSASVYASPLLPALTSPGDFLLTALACGGLVALACVAVEAWRPTWRGRRHDPSEASSLTRYVLMQAVAGIAVAALLAGYFVLLDDTVANTTVDLLQFSLHPWNTARLALQVGIIVWHAGVLGLAVLLLRVARIPWSVTRRRVPVAALTLLLWIVPLAIWPMDGGAPWSERIPLLGTLVVAVVLSGLITAVSARYRHGSQAFRLLVLTIGLVVPALAFYPTIFRLAREAKIELVETRYAPEALNQRQTIQRLISESLEEIDNVPGLPQLVAPAQTSEDADAQTDRAFQVWRVTGLANYPVTSSVELYGSDGRLVSRFAFNLPEDLTTVPRSVEQSCRWNIFEEVSPFFAEERRVLHAGRTVCASGTSGAERPIGSIVVHAILDYANLPFIASQNPYVELLRPGAALRDESLSGRDVEYAVFGWSRRPLYMSREPAWDLDDVAFARAEQSRDPFWATLRRGDDRYTVYLLNDRFGIYGLGFPVVSVLGHLVNLAELTVLAAGTALVLLMVNACAAAMRQRATSARALLREIRASFYRKLFLAFVAATIVPVIALAIATRNYVAGELNDNIEQEAVRTVASARRVIEDLVAPRTPAQGATIDDNLMVWVSRLIGQDANIFRGPRLQATSERNLFASALLPVRTPAPVYDALALRQQATTVTRDRIGTLEYLTAAAPVTTRQPDIYLTIPLTARQQEIEDQIDTLNRRVLLGALVFILAGAGLGYSMAERIADPVNRLSRATRRIARGELDVRIAARSSDELRRLVEDFNSMAAELRHQREKLERTHRLEAWADMARQVAHDIKNPLTPIQLNAEHLRRVHADRGRPLSPVLDECVTNILRQVKLLRQIASEFSNFASSPTAKPAPVDVAGLLREIVDPYRAALEGRTHFEIDLPATLLPAHVDRSLIARALTNIVENALHAMPEGGTLRVSARLTEGVVEIRISDTGVGMDDEALGRAFEPYFSTKATGTGLGLPIAKRNVELNGGTIAIHTARDQGTTVVVGLPTATLGV